MAKKSNNLQYVNDIDNISSTQEKIKSINAKGRCLLLGKHY